MKFSIRFADKIVGTLVILALAILIFVIFMLGRSQRWFMKDYQYKTHFNSASGVSPNMAIQYKGFTLGHVKHILLTEDDKVEVIFNIFEEYGYRVKEGSMVELQASPIGLGNAFIFHPGKGEQLPEGSVIPEINSPEAKQLVASGLAEKIESSDRINSILTNVNSLLLSVNNSLTNKDAEGKTAIDGIIGDIQGTIAGIESIINDIAIKADPILANLNSAISNFDSVVENVDVITAPDGSVITSINSALESISGIMDSVDDSVKVVPENLPKIIILLSDLHSALTEAEKLIISLSNNPLLRGGIPETRETAPGGTNPRNMNF